MWIGQTMDWVENVSVHIFIIDVYIKWLYMGQFLFDLFEPIYYSTLAYHCGKYHSILIKVFGLFCF